jgi:hypothetical protein
MAVNEGNRASKSILLTQEAYIQVKKAIRERRSNYEAAVGPRLVSHPESAPSLDDIPSDSLCAVADALAAFPCRARSRRVVCVLLFTSMRSQLFISAKGNSYIGKLALALDTSGCLAGPGSYWERLYVQMY